MTRVRSYGLIYAASSPVIRLNSALNVFPHLLHHSLLLELGQMLLHLRLCTLSPCGLTEYSLPMLLLIPNSHFRICILVPAGYPALIARNM
jgi:hypothetical protein